MITVRPAEEKDTQAIAEVILHIQQAEFAIPITLDDQPDLRSIAQFYQRGAGNFWVAEFDRHIVGTIALLDIGNHEAALRKMFVAAPFRGRDVGTAGALLGTLIDWSARQGLGSVYLGTTAKFLAAHRFYEKSGFAEIAKASLPAAFPIMAVDSKFYKLSLPRGGESAPA
jgi:N-acetylglutamate synthase-like GNAT family acetyltransferase